MAGKYISIANGDKAIIEANNGNNNFNDIRLGLFKMSII
jgi:hypothetical protein